ncbi:MAG: hypothetical protein IJT87_04380 [Ruminiclostridium sp.]|nr:hypothetical protein [Ruminiclostridium sp.]
MKITSFNPIIVTKDRASAVELFEQLGFEQRHHSVITDSGSSNTDMVNADGYRVDIAQNDRIPGDMTFIRMNVDDFDEAYQILLKYGFKNSRGDGTLNENSAKAATMFSPSGFVISIVQHIKE